MRKFGLFVFSLSVALAARGGVYLPESSAEQLNAAPLERGQTVWTEAENGLYATAFVGGDGGKPLIVRDPAALHGYTPTPFASDRYAILPTGDFTVVSNCYTLAANGKRGTIEIVVADGTPIHRLRHRFVDNAFMSNNGDWGLATNTVKITGNRATITMISGGATDEFWFESLEFLPPGQSAEVKNTLDTIIPVQFIGHNFRIGTLDLHKWPHYLLHFWDFNRGEHWANWPATNTVALGENALMWKSYDIGERNGNLEMNYGGVPYLHFVPGAANRQTNGWSIAFTAIEPHFAERTVDLQWRITAPTGVTIDPARFTVRYARVLPLASQGARNLNRYEPFRWIPAEITSTQSSGGGLLVSATVAMGEGESGYYRISYTPDPAANRAKFTATIEAPAMILTDTATGKRYRLTVANGQLSLTQED